MYENSERVMNPSRWNRQNRHVEKPSADRGRRCEDLQSKSKEVSRFNKGEKYTAKVVEKVSKCFNFADESHMKKDFPKRHSKRISCNQPGHRAAQCQVGIEPKQTLYK